MPDPLERLGRRIDESGIHCEPPRHELTRDDQKRVRRANRRRLFAGDDVDGVSARGCLEINSDENLPRPRVNSKCRKFAVECASMDVGNLFARRDGEYDQFSRSDAACLGRDGQRWRWRRPNGLRISNDGKQ